MAITTRVTPFYAGQKLFAALLCLVFGVWGAYDYFYKIPHQDNTFNRYQSLQNRMSELEQQLVKQGGFGTPEQAQELQDLKVEMLAISPTGAEPVKPGKFNRATQWVYMACLPAVPIFLILFINATRQRYRLEDDGTLRFEGDKELKSGAWSSDEIVDIDMSRWMAKSIAYAVHADGRRLKLDAYIHKDLHLIIGAIASRLHPDQWNAEAKMVKSAAGDQADDSEGDASGGQPVSEAATT